MTDNELMHLFLTDYPAFLEYIEEYFKDLEIAEWLNL